MTTDTQSKPAQPINWGKAFSSKLLKPLPVTVEEAIERQNAPYLKYPKLMFWKDLKADKRGFNWVDTEREFWRWPDQTEDWDEEVQAIIDAERASTEREALDLLYKEDEDFRSAMDKLWEAESEYCAQQDHKRRMAVLHRAAWTAVWARRIRGPAVPVRWVEQQQCECPKCAGKAAVQATDTLKKRKAQCESCGYRFKLIRGI